MSSKYRLALVGAGVIGKHHANVITELHDQLELVAVADHELDRAREVTERHGGLPFRTLDEVLANTDPEIVSVCTPTGTHGDVTIQALKAGTHVIVEKPAEITVERIDAMAAAQSRAGKLVTVISQHRFDRAAEIVLNAVADGRLGRLTSGTASIDWWREQSYYDSGGWRGTWQLDGGGALMNQGIHTVDLLVTALGVPVEVFAYTGLLAHRDIEVEDVAVAVIRFANGALGLIHASTAAYPGLSARLHLHGDRGSAAIDDDQLAYLHLDRDNPTVSVQGAGGGADNRVPLDLGEEATPTAGSEPGRFSAAHRRQYENFLAALRGDEELRVSLAANRRSVSVIRGVYESARTGRPVRVAAAPAGPGLSEGQVPDAYDAVPAAGQGDRAILHRRDSHSFDAPGVAGQWQPDLSTGGEIP